MQQINQFCCCLNSVFVFLTIEERTRNRPQINCNNFNLITMTNQYVKTENFTHTLMIQTKAADFYLTVIFNADGTIFTDNKSVNFCTCNCYYMPYALVFCPSCLRKHVLFNRHFLCLALFLFSISDI